MGRRTKYISVNNGQCLTCGSLLISLHRHDFVACKCKGTKNQFVDGGFNYNRRTLNLKSLPLYWKVSE